MQSGNSSPSGQAGAKTDAPKPNMIKLLAAKRKEAEIEQGRAEVKNMQRSNDCDEDRVSRALTMNTGGQIV